MSQVYPTSLSAVCRLGCARFSQAGHRCSGGWKPQPDSPEGCRGCAAHLRCLPHCQQPGERSSGSPVHSSLTGARTTLPFPSSFSSSAFVWCISFMDPQTLEKDLNGGWGSAPSSAARPTRKVWGCWALLSHRHGLPGSRWAQTMRQSRVASSAAWPRPRVIIPVSRAWKG